MHEIRRLVMVAVKVPKQNTGIIFKIGSERNRRPWAKIIMVLRLLRMTITIKVINEEKGNRWTPSGNGKLWMPSIREEAWITSAGLSC